jgi:hypothetical protein
MVQEASMNRRSTGWGLKHGVTRGLQAVRWHWTPTPSA